MSYSFCSDDFAVQPYGWNSTPRPQADNSAVPGKTDVLVIGSGYTGLQCALQTAQAGRHTTVIDAEDLPPNLQEKSLDGSAPQIGSEVSLDDLERRHIESILRKTGSHQIRAAEILGIDRRTLYRKLIKYGLKPSAQERGDKDK